MAFTPVKSYTFPTGGLRANGPTGPTPPKQQPGFNTLYGLLNPGTTNPAAPFSTDVNAGSSANPSVQARAQAASGAFDPSAKAGGFNFGPGGPTVDQLSTDPILQQIRAAGQRNVADARQGALANAENALIGYGGVQVPQNLRDLFAGDQTSPILAALTDANTASAAAGNPDSTLKRLATTDLRNNAGIDQGENANNLFYSSDRGNKLGGEADSYRQAQGQAAQSLGGLLGQANQGVLGAEQQAENDYLGGLSGAWDRWLQMQSLLGGPGGGGGSGTPTSSGQTSTPATSYPNPLSTSPPVAPTGGGLVAPPAATVGNAGLLGRLRGPLLPPGYRKV